MKSFLVSFLSLLPLAVADLLLRSEGADGLKAHHAASRQRQSSIVLASGAAEDEEPAAAAALSESSDSGKQQWLQSCNVSSTWYYVKIATGGVGFLVQCGPLPGTLVCMSQSPNGQCSSGIGTQAEPENLAAVCPSSFNFNTTTLNCPNQTVGTIPAGTNTITFNVQPNSSYVDPCNATVGLGCYPTTTPLPSIAAAALPELAIGPQGATGAQGAVGDQGYSPPIGTTGDPGNNGQQGTQGPTGDQGPTGKQGQQGLADQPEEIPNDIAPTWWGLVVPFAQLVLVGCGYQWLKNFLEDRKKEIEFAKTQDWGDAGAVGSQW